MNFQCFFNFVAVVDVVSIFPDFRMQSKLHIHFKYLINEVVELGEDGSVVGEHNFR